jgi:hypothetical protein
MTLPSRLLQKLHIPHPAMLLPTVALGAWFVAPFVASALALGETAPRTENPAASVGAPLTPTPRTAPPTSTPAAEAAAPIDAPSGNLIGALFGSSPEAAFQPAPTPPPQSDVAPAQPSSPNNKRAKELWEERSRPIEAREKQDSREGSEPSRSADQPRTAEGNKTNDNKREDAPRANLVGRKEGEGGMMSGSSRSSPDAQRAQAPPVHIATAPPLATPPMRNAPPAPPPPPAPLPPRGIMRPPVIFCCRPLMFRPLPAPSFVVVRHR